MNILGTSTEEDTVLNNIITATDTDVELIGSAFVSVVLITHLTQCQQVVHKEITSLGINAKMEFRCAAVTGIEAGHRSTHIHFALFELGVCAQRHHESSNHHCNFLHTQNC